MEEEQGADDTAPELVPGAGEGDEKSEPDDPQDDEKKPVIEQKPLQPLEKAKPNPPPKPKPEEPSVEKKVEVEAEENKQSS